jgi:hypothetical protein
MRQMLFTAVWVVLFAVVITSGCGGSNKTSSSSGSTGASGTTLGNPGSTTGGPCGSVTVTGNCSGTVLTYCDPSTDTLVSEDCALQVQGEPWICAEVDPIIGFTCEAQTGGHCVFQDSQGNVFPVFCAGTGAACVIGASDARCQTGQPTCTLAAGGQQPPPVCLGNIAQVFCDENQPVGYDCDNLGGACSNGSCINLPSGQACDNQTFVCKTGLTCAGADGGAGVCQ